MVLIFITVLVSNSQSWRGGGGEIRAFHTAVIKEPDKLSRECRGPKAAGLQD